MYTPLKSYQVIISLLKQHGIRHCVLSAGTRNIPFVQSVENDPYFKCYSVVDERSAAYMALGLSLRLDEPVVISCTSSTATCNYFPAIAEAFHQGGQLIVLTSDRNPALQGQREDQMINQINMYGNFVKKAVNLPIVNTAEDLWHCQRLVNEAILEVSHHGKGPVQINIPMLAYMSRCTENECLTARPIRRYTVESPVPDWEECAKVLNRDMKRVMVICGQMNRVSPALNELLGKFVSLYRGVLLADYMSNVECPEALNPFLAFDTRVMSDDSFSDYVPDVVISLGGNTMCGIKALLRAKGGQFEHWGIEESGEIVDMYKGLTKVFECTPEYFFRYFTEHYEEMPRSTAYRDSVSAYVHSVQLPDVPYSNNWAVARFVRRIPDGSLLHLSINNSIRLVNYFGLPNRSVRVYANIGTHGIDGCLSSFVGQALASDKLSFLVIGDLSFFYDMGAMRIKHMPRTARILMINNHGGGEFHYSTTLKVDPTLDWHTSALHGNVAEGWVKSVGFEYIAVHKEADYEPAIDHFVDPSVDHPVFIEFFSDMETDAGITHMIEEVNRNQTVKDRLKTLAGNMARSVLSDGAVKKVKKVIGK